MANQSGWSRYRHHKNGPRSTLWSFVAVARRRMVAVIGKPAPDFACRALVDGELKDVSLSDYKGKYVILFFYPMDL